MIFVVDDDHDLRESLVETLEDEGYDARWARDGQDALAELQRIPVVHLILLDLNMPTMDGQAFRAAIRTDPRRASIPLVVMSGERDWQQIASGLGAAAAFPKPFSVDRLLGMFRRLLNDLEENPGPAR